MESIIKPLVYIGIIFLAIALKQAGVFGKDDYRILSRIVMNITLPLTVVHVCVGFRPEPSMYWLVLIGFLCALLPMLTAFVVLRKKEAGLRAFGMINSAGGNIGAFILPIVQVFYGAAGAVSCSMYDIGNALVMAGGGYAATCALLHLNQGGQKGIWHTVGGFLKNVVTSVTFDAYFIMLLLMACHVRLPEILGTVTAPFAEANAFVAMFMVGLMFQPQKDREKIKAAFQTIGIRVGTAAVLALVIYYGLPVEPKIRQIAALCAFAPVGTLAPVFTEKSGGDGALASFLNSITVFISFFILLILVYTIF